MLKNNDGCYIARFNVIPWYWGIIVAIYLSSDESKFIVEKYAVWNKNDHSEIKYFPIESWPVGYPLLTDTLNNCIQVLWNQWRVEGEKLFADERPAIFIYTEEEVKRDLQRSFEESFVSLNKFLGNQFKEIADKTQCKKLKEDILKAVSGQKRF